LLHVVCYATPSHEGSQLLLKESAEKYNVTVHTCSPKDLDPDFISNNEELFKVKLGAGVWIWKPYIIKKILHTIPKDDTLIYMDSDNIFINDPHILDEHCRKYDIGLFTQPYANKVWTKKECFEIMDADSQEYYDHSLTTSGINVWRHSTLSYSVLEDWLHYAQNPRISTRDPGTNNFPEFKRHSTDQSILANLSVKYNVHNYLRPDWNPQTTFPEYSITKHFPYRVAKVFGRFSLQQLDIVKQTKYLVKITRTPIQTWLEIPQQSRYKTPLIPNPYYEGD
jgi:hypothetical protein